MNRFDKSVAIEQDTAATDSDDMQNMSRFVRYRALAVVLTASFLAPLDFFIVNVSLPTLKADLNATAGQLQLVIAVYALAYAVLLITGGRLGDIYGRRKLFIIGLAGFTVASGLCGMAPNPTVLIIARGLQGLFGAIMFPQSLSVIQVLFPPAERAPAFAISGMVSSVGAFLGNVLGGALLHANLFGLEWRPLFLLNIPIGIAGVIGALLFLPESRSETARTLDWGGVVLATLALVGIVLPLAEGRESGWPFWMIALLILGVLLLPVFVWYERRITARGQSPLIELSLFREPAFAIGSLTGLIFFTAPPTFALVFTIFLQDGKGFTPEHAGYLFIPFTVAFMAASFGAIRLSQFVGARVINIGLVMMLIGSGGLIYLMQQPGRFSLTPLLLASMLIYGGGQGFIMPIISRVTLSRVPPDDAGSAGGILSTLQQVGAAFGVTLTAGLFFAMLGKTPNEASFLRAAPAALMINAVLLAITYVIALRLPKELSAKMASGGLASSRSATPVAVAE